LARSEAGRLLSFVRREELPFLPSVERSGKPCSTPPVDEEGKAFHLIPFPFSEGWVISDILPGKREEEALSVFL